MGKAILQSTRKLSVWKFFLFTLPSIYPRYIYPHYPQIVKVLFREKILENTLES